MYIILVRTWWQMRNKMMLDRKTSSFSADLCYIEEIEGIEQRLLQLGSCLVHWYIHCLVSHLVCNKYVMNICWIVTAFKLEGKIQKRERDWRWKVWGEEMGKVMQEPKSLVELKKGGGGRRSMKKLRWRKKLSWGGEFLLYSLVLLSI